LTNNWAGKTVVMELAIIRLLKKQMQEQGSLERVRSSKVVYIAPIKVLSPRKVFSDELDDRLCVNKWENNGRRSLGRLA
jgi:hypothetical protein